MYSTVPFARVHVRISIFFVYVFCVCLSHVRCDRLDETTLQTVILYLIECTISFHSISFDYITLQILLYIIIFCYILLYFIIFCYILLYFIIFHYILLHFVTFYEIILN